MNINISFLARSSRQKSNGQVPIYYYLFTGKKVNRFSTGFYIHSINWDRQKQKKAQPSRYFLTVILRS
jgi:hypothetical protein